MRALFADRDFRLLFAGLVPSMFGDSAMFIVLAIWAKDLTDSNAAAAPPSSPWWHPPRSRRSWASSSTGRAAGRS